MGRQGLTAPIRAWFAAHRLHHRRGFLHLVGWIYVAHGISVAEGERVQFSRPGPSPLDWADSPWWAAMWLVAAVGALWVSFARRDHHRDTAGFGVIIVPPLVWGALAAYSWLVALATDGAFGHYHVWPVIWVWWGIAGIIRLVATWEEPLPSEIIASRVIDRDAP